MARAHLDSIRRAVDLPQLLGGSIRLASHPPELTLAEKIATMMSRRELNTRDRDFADVWTLSRTLALDAAEALSQRRSGGVDLPPHALPAP